MCGCQVQGLNVDQIHDIAVAREEETQSHVRSNSGPWHERVWAGQPEQSELKGGQFKLWRCDESRGQAEVEPGKKLKELTGTGNARG